MAWVKTGTVSVTNGGSAVVGSGTSWFGSLQTGWAFVGPDGRVYEILTVDSATQITLASNYLGATAAGQYYAAMPTSSLAADLTAALQTLISNYQGVYDGPGQGMFSGLIRFLSDQDTGLGNPSDNEVALKAGDVWQLTLKGGVASGAAVQSSATDGTIGKLLKFGAFGLGVADGTVAPDVVDMDTAPTGFGRISGGTVGSKPPGVTSGTVFTGVNQAGRTSQLVFRAASNRVYVRTKHDNVWRSWSEIYCAENVLGLVSQSAGVPTGAVIERSGNANGEYVRFADGTQICTIERTLNLTTAADGALHKSLSDFGVWVFPASFTAPPVVTANAHAGSQWAEAGAVNSIQAAAVVIWSSAALTAASRSISAVAVGRWF